jgi:hypothetical protein
MVQDSSESTPLQVPNSCEQILQTCLQLETHFSSISNNAQNSPVIDSENSAVFTFEDRTFLDAAQKGDMDSIQNLIAGFSSEDIDYEINKTDEVKNIILI